MRFIKTEVPQEWNRTWLLMWLVVSVILLVLAFLLPFTWWTVAAAIGFGVPELISLVSSSDGLPPLTQTIRHFLPGWFTFSFIYFMLGTIGATWLGFPRPLALGGLFALLGWLTEHFTVTYLQEDPRPRPDPRTPQGRMAL